MGSHRLSTRALLAAWLALSSVGCGVFFGDPIDLYPSREEADLSSLPVNEPCLEEATLMTGSSETIIDVPARDLAALADNARDSELLWPPNTKTRIHVTLSDPKVYSVRSRINQRGPQRLAYDQCAHYVRIDARVHMKTDDGKLDEVVEKVSFRAYDSGEAQAVFVIERAALRGSYKPRSLGTRCHQRTSFHLLAAYDGSHGAMVDEVRGASCDQAEQGQLTQLAGGRWGHRWAH